MKTRVQKVYDELARMESEGVSSDDPQVRELRKELRALQKEISRRYERYFDKEVLGPLKRSKELIAQMRRRLGM